MYCVDDFSCDSVNSVAPFFATSPPLILCQWFRGRIWKRRFIGLHTRQQEISLSHGDAGWCRWWGLYSALHHKRSLNLFNYSRNLLPCHFTTRLSQNYLKIKSNYLDPKHATWPLCANMTGSWLTPTWISEYHKYYIYVEINIMSYVHEHVIYYIQIYLLFVTSACT